MNCCPNCFKDKEVIGIIESTSTQLGNCDYCSTIDVKIVPASELYNYFEELILTYGLPSSSDIPDDAFKFLYEHFIDWYIFNFDDENKIAALVKDIGGELYKDQPALFEHIVAPRIMLDPTSKNLVSRYMDTWENFKKEIKNTNRFFVQNSLDFDSLKDILHLFEKNYKKGKLFYRSRTSDKDGVAIVEMGRPPAKLATGGRANPQGISYLYLSNDIRTTLYEVRATLYDYVSVAEFRLTDEIKIASLRNTEKVSPFIIPNIGIYLLYKKFILLLEADLVKPLRRHDSELDYLPTQYLCEFIKSLGYDGIEYSSSLNPDGFNIALFSDQKIDPVTVKVYEIKNILYNYIVA